MNFNWRNIVLELVRVIIAAIAGYSGGAAM